MAEINHEIKIQAPIAAISKALGTLKGLRAWHTAHIEGSDDLNGVLVFKAKDKPTFNWKITQKEPEKFIWECVEGPGDSKGTHVIYKITKTDDGRSLVELSHTEWPGQDGNFRKCNTLWGILLHHLKNYAETGTAEPAFN